MIIQKKGEAFITEDIKQIMRSLPTKISFSSIVVLAIAAAVLGGVFFMRLPVMKQINNSSFSYLEKGMASFSYNAAKLTSIKVGSRIILESVDEKGRKHIFEAKILEINILQGNKARASFSIPAALTPGSIQSVLVEIQQLSIIKRIWS